MKKKSPIKNVTPDKPFKAPMNNTASKMLNC